MRFLIVEDDPGMGLVLRQKLGVILAKFPHATITLVKSLAAAKHELESYPCPSTTILDLALLDSTWEETIAEAPTIDSRSPVVIITGYPIEKVRALLTDSSIEILPKTPEVISGDGLIQAIVRAFNRKVERENQILKENSLIMHSLLESYGPTRAPE